MRLGSGERGDALNEVGDALGRATLLGAHVGDDLLCLGLRKSTLAKEGLAVVVMPRDDRLARGTDARDERPGELSAKCTSAGAA